MRTAGKISIGQIAVLALIVVGGYFGVQYLPLISQKAAGRDVARRAAAKMVIEPNDAIIREFVQTEATKKGLAIPPSLVVLRRNYPNPGMFTVELRWTYQMKQIGGKAKQVEVNVAEVADLSGGKVLKNAE